MFHAMWTRLEIRRCEALLQTIEIAEMNVTETISHRSHLHDQRPRSNAIIYISKEGESFWTMALSTEFEKFFKIPKIANEVDKIFCESLRGSPLDELLGSIWKIPELPMSWQDELYSKNARASEVPEDSSVLTVEVLFL